MLLDLLNKRTSIRSFTGENIPVEIIDNILEAGRLSPSGGNEQPWKFGVIDDRERIKKISELAYHQQWIETASFLIVLCTCIVGKERGGRDVEKARFPRVSEVIETMDENLYSFLMMEEHQTKIPGTHMMLAALEHGIYGTWVSYFDVEKLTEYLRLPKGLIASEFIAFGYPVNKKEPLRKKSKEELVFYNVFPEE
jgi:nitroreductase